jgi:hypothetical protein
MSTEVTKEVGKVNLVVDALKLKQGELNDSQFAKRLGISNVMWIYLKNNQRLPGKKIYSAVMREYPDLIPTVLMAMTEK